jgi:beta-lactamase superfamily II metal-dependent hydrolase
MLCEVEFLAVGEGSRAGDAIVVRYGEVNNYRLMVVDGGTADTGEQLVAHLKTQFGHDVVLDHVVLTHSDADHASGLREVLREIPATYVWLHIPWLLSDEAIHLFKNKNWTKETLSAAIKKEYDVISEIVGLAVAAQTTQKIFYPFQGSQIGPFTVLSPRKQTYLHLLPQFEKTPEPDQDLLEAANMWIGKAPTGLIKEILRKAAAKVSNWWPESWSQERLRDGGQTSASNESSVVLYADCGDGRRMLLTGDAGINALTWAASHAKASGYLLQQFSFVQIPHHGSRRNVGPTVLNELLGPIQLEGSDSRFTAFVSTPKDDDQHPRKIVLNAFMRRGGTVIATQGQNKVHCGGFPPRPGYVAVEPVSFSPKVEAYE